MSCSARIRVAALCWLAAVPAVAAPVLYRVVPFGGMRGAEVTVELIGEHLANATGVWFDTDELRWRQTAEPTAGLLRGRVQIGARAALGPHILFVRTKDGRTNSRLFNVTQFPSVPEQEPNDPPGPPQRVELKPQVIHGYMRGRVDIDVFTFHARAGERWTFDLRSIEYGSHLECEMLLEDAEGRTVASNDDRDDYVESPFLEHTFGASGTYRLKLDQYRGPQQVDCGTNCGYMLQISQLPVVLAASRLGFAPGAVARLKLHGRALDEVEEVFLTRARGGEYYRLTFPYTMPVAARPDPRADAIPRIAARILRRSAQELETEIRVPEAAETGLWRLWTRSAAGRTDHLSIEIARVPEMSEAEAATAALGVSDVAVNASLDRDGEEDSYSIAAKKGQPLHVWTLATQMGLPYLDTVLELFDEKGKLVAGHDDLMTGQGTVIGNPDSSLYYVPEADGRLRLVVRDRIGRGGPTFAYRLRFASEWPGFQLQTDPEEFAVARGQETDLAVLLIPDPGFKDPVDVWAEGMPEGLSASRASFRPSQYFGPSDDGDNVIIPDVHLKIRAASTVAPGEYPVRVFGRAAGGGPLVEAFTTLWIGPPRKRNDVRRPLPAVTVTVVEPFAAKLAARETSLRLPAGGSGKLSVAAEAVPADAPLRATGVPPGLRPVLTRTGDEITLTLEAGTEVSQTSARVAVEARAGDRWAATEAVEVTVTAAAGPGPAGR